MPDEDKKKKEEAGEGGRGGDRCRCRIKKKIRRKTCKLYLGIDRAGAGLREGLEEKHARHI